MKRFNLVVIVLSLLLVGGSEYVSSDQLSDPLDSPESIEKKRGFLFEIGGGMVGLSYGSDTDAYLAYIASYGLQRGSLMLNVNLGWYITGNAYFLLSATGIGDRLEDVYGYYMQLNTYLFAPGIKYYPFGRGLSLGSCAGLSRIVAVSNVGTSTVSSFGYGVKLFAAYDLLNKYTGFGLDIGIAANYMFIEGESVAATSLFLDLVWK